MKLYAVRVFVTDWERSLHFYSEILGIPIAFRGDDMGWAELETGDAKLALERMDPNDPEAEKLIGRFVGASLQVDDIAGTYSSLVERGVEFLTPPEQQPWGGTLAHFLDPDRNVLTLLG